MASDVPDGNSLRSNTFFLAGGGCTAEVPARISAAAAAAAASEAGLPGALFLSGGVADDFEPPAEALLELPACREGFSAEEWVLPLPPPPEVLLLLPLEDEGSCFVLVKESWT